jgi:hypothetical protein
MTTTPAPDELHFVGTLTEEDDTIYVYGLGGLDGRRIEVKEEDNHLQYRIPSLGGAWSDVPGSENTHVIRDNKHIAEDPMVEFPKDPNREPIRLAKLTDNRRGSNIG